MRVEDFKVGDRVQRINDVNINPNGVGTVVRLGDYVYVQFDHGGRSFGSYPQNLILLDKEFDYETDE